MNRQDIRRFEAAGLFVLFFLGGVIHTLTHTFVLITQVADKLMHEGKLLNELLKTYQGTGFLVMFAVWFGAMMLPIFLALLLKSKKGYWVTTIVGALVVLANIAHAIAHISIGDVTNGIANLVMSGVTGVWAVVFMLQLARGKV